MNRLTTTSSNDSTGTTVMMVPWLHFRRTDHLLFRAWRPSSVATIAGACIGLVVLAILDRCLAAYRRSLESKWRLNTFASTSTSPCIPIDDASPCVESRSKDGIECDIHDKSLEILTTNSRRRRHVLPWSPSRDVSRGVIHAIQSILLYALMLVVMTFNGAYIIAIVLGLGIGEALVGRIGREWHV